MRPSPQPDFLSRSPGRCSATRASVRLGLWVTLLPIMIHSETHGDVTVFRLAHGKANALDLELCRALSTTFESFAASDAKAAVLTAEGGIFSAGVDLKRLLEDGPDAIEAFLEALDAAFRALAFCPKPIVGAASGHAIAGGCVLLSACDRRLMADGKGRIGVPELLVGVPFPVLALEIMREVVATPHLARVVYGGKTFQVAEAAAMGLVDEVVPPEDLQARALATAQQLAAIPAASFRLSKASMRSALSARLAAQTDLEAEIRRAWNSPATRGAIEAFVRATLS